MPPIRQDLSNVSQFTVLPNGDYAGFLFTVELTTSKGAKTAGTPMLKVVTKLEGKNGRAFDNVLLNNDTLWKWKQLCLAAGIEEDRLGADSDVATEELVGRPVIVTLGYKPASGGYDEGNVVKKYHNPETYVPSEADGLAATGTDGW